MSDFTFDVMIEIPKGSRNKYEYDKKNKVMRLDRMLHPTMVYPCDYGFIPQTLADDGDPLDVLVLIWEPTFPGCVIEVKPIGMMKMWDDKGQDEKVIAVPVGDPHYRDVKTLKEIPQHLLTVIDNFFSTYKILEKKKAGVEGWADVDETIALIKKTRENYKG